MRSPVFILLIASTAMLLACGCASFPEQETQRTVAVWDLENLSPGTETRPDLGGLLGSEIIQTVQQTGDIQVVEREKLVAILEELRLGSSILTDESTRLKVGRLLGAREMIFGGYMVVGSTMRIDLRRVEVETGRVLKTAKQTAAAGDLAAWLAAARQAGRALYP